MVDLGGISNLLIYLVIGAALFFLFVLVVLVIFLMRRRRAANAEYQYEEASWQENQQYSPPAAGWGQANGPIIPDTETRGSSSSALPTEHAPSPGGFNTYAGGSETIATPPPALESFPPPPPPFEAEPPVSEDEETVVMRPVSGPKVLGLLINRKQPNLRYDVDRFNVTVGRSASNVIILDNPTVSRQHASLKLEGDNYVVYDLGSANGTYVNDHSVREPVPIEDGDVVRFGEVEFTFKLVSLD